MRQKQSKDNPSSTLRANRASGRNDISAFPFAIRTFRSVGHEPLRTRVPHQPADAGAIVKISAYKDSLCGFGLRLPAGPFDEFPLTKVTPARTNATRCGAFTARERSCAAWMSLNAIASPAARAPPRVFRTVIYV
jgi:hypothetical protein